MSSKQSPNLPSTLPNIVPLFIFRVMHIGSLMALSYKVINDYQKGLVSLQSSSIYAFAGLLIMISGFINTFLLEPKKMGQNRKLWISWHHLKLLITLLMFTPVYKYIPFMEGSLVNLRFYWFVLLALISPAARFYREHYVKFNQMKKMS